MIFLKFEMWSFGHIIYILSPANIMTALYFLLRNKSYKVLYLNNIDEANVEIEMQCKEVMK